MIRLLLLLLLMPSLASAAGVGRTGAIGEMGGPVAGGGDDGIVLQDTASVYGSGDITTEYTVASGDNRILVVVLSQLSSSSTGPSVVTWNGTTMDTLANETQASYSTNFRYLVNPEVGTYNIVATGVGSTNNVAVVSSWTGVHQTTPFGTAVTRAAYGTPSITVTADVGDVVIDGLSIGTESVSPDASQTLIGKIANASALGGSSYEVAATTSVVMSWNQSSKHHSMVGAAMKPAE